MRVILAVAVLLGSTSLARAELDPTTLQAILDDAREAGYAPGAMAAINQGGSVVWQGQSGYASLDQSEPLGAEHLFGLGSVGKTYTAVMTLKLAEQGYLSLDAPLENYVPDLPGADQVTIRMLLSQHSGYPEVYENEEIAEHILDWDFEWNRDVLLDKVEAPTVTPGSQFEYINTNYIILGEVIERASGKPVEEVLQETITGPLGLTNTFLAVEESVNARLAHPVLVEGDEVADVFALAGRVPSALYGPSFMCGGIVSNASDVCLFFSGLFNGEIIGPEMLSEMLEVDPDIGYGLGIMKYNPGGETWYVHTGAYGGYTAMAGYHPESDLALVTLTNLQTDFDFPAGEVWDSFLAATSVPEPTSFAMLLSAVMLFAGCKRIRRK